MARKRSATPDVVVIVDPHTAAMAKAQQPGMLIKDNPLACTPTPNERLAEFNMDRLYKDAALRRDPVHGRVYEGIMSKRYGG